jgi:hypothetical protein
MSCTTLRNGHGAAQGSSTDTLLVDRNERIADDRRPPVLLAAESGAGSARVRRFRRSATCAVLRRKAGTSQFDAWYVLPAAVDRALRKASIRSAELRGAPAIRWPCAASLGWASTRCHPSTRRSRTLRLIALEAHRAVFTWILQVLATADLVKGKTIGIDATTLEANAAFRSIVRRDSGESYQGFLTRLAQASGIETPTRAIWRVSIASVRRRAQQGLAESARSGRAHYEDEGRPLTSALDALTRVARSDTHRRLQVNGQPHEGRPRRRPAGRAVQRRLAPGTASQGRALIANELTGRPTSSVGVGRGAVRSATLAR